METGMSTTRLVVSVVIILGCFTVLYPRFFHPIILQIFGMAPPKQTQSDSIPRRPHMPPGKDMPRGGAEDIRSHIRPGPHPGMRAAAEMNAQQQTRGSGRGGVMSTVLPMYAVGITVYLVYTLVKVFNKKGNYEKEKERRNARQKRLSDSYLQQHVDRPLTREERVQEFVESSQRLNEIEDLLTKADDKHINEDDMRELQRRLEETEAQMARIMQAMQTVSSKVSTVASDTDKAPANENDKPKESEEDLTPDSSSYEVISNKSDKSSDSSPEVETIKASETQKTEIPQQKDSELSEANIKKEGDNDDAVEPVEDIMMDEQKEEDDEEDTNVRKRKGRTTSD